MASTSVIPRVSVHVNFNFSENRKEGFRIFHEETFIFPFHNEEEENAAFQYIRKQMKKHDDFYLYVVRLEDNDKYNKDGAKVFDEFPVKMIAKDLIDNKDDVARIAEWDGNRYCANEHISSLSAAFKDLMETVSLHENWICQVA